MSDSADPSSILLPPLQDSAGALAAAQTEAEIAGALALAAGALGAHLTALLLDGAELRSLKGGAGRGTGDEPTTGPGLALAHAALAHQAPQSAPGRAALPLNLSGECLGALLVEGPADTWTAPLPALGALAAPCAAALGRVRTLDDLRRQGEQFRQLVEHSPVGMVIGWPDGRIEEVNGAYLTLLGYTREQFLAGEVGWPGLHSPEALAAAARGAVTEALRLGRSGPHVTSVLTRDGHLLPLSVTLMRIGSEDRPQLVAYVRDLREQAAAEQLLQDRTASLEALLRGNHQELGLRAEALLAQHAELAIRTRALDAFALLSRDLVLETDRYALVRRAQEITVDLLPPGYAVYYEPEGQLWRLKSQVGELGHPDLQAVVDAGLPLDSTQNLNLPWRTGEPLYQDNYDIDTDQLGELTRHIGATASLPVMLDGRPVGVFAVALLGRRRWSVTDRTVMETATFNLGLALDRARAIAEVATRTAELERSNAELERFAYVASHDLQAPLRAMTSFADLLTHRYGKTLDERGRLYLQQISENGTHMKRLVDDLLGFSRLHTGRMETGECDMNALFDHLRLRLHSEIVALGAQVTRGPLPPVHGHGAQLDQLLQNLVQNGLKYHRPGVTPTVEVSARREGREWVFAVKDNGIGIEPQHFGRIFVIFQRLHGREQYEGTGIGLAICQKIVERHGGRLWVESTPGEGSTFFFTLPAPG
ncbi:ATP-binding protein [Deinococcus petrolearius]|uniref:histidine kinase n=1 Tax=Deinococcus petrolearius TaxID=1751295 RepID=A0ABW1DG78_9DEIO